MFLMHTESPNKLSIIFRSNANAAKLTLFYSKIASQVFLQFNMYIIFERNVLRKYTLV